MRLPMILLNLSFMKLLGSVVDIEYRDLYTRKSSKAVADFAKTYQEYSDLWASRRKSLRRPVYTSVLYKTELKGRIGRRRLLQSIFDFQASRNLHPIEDLKRNKPLKEIECERIKLLKLQKQSEPEVTFKLQTSNHPRGIKCLQKDWKMFRECSLLMNDFKSYHIQQKNPRSKQTSFKDVLLQPFSCQKMNTSIIKQKTKSYSKTKVTIGKSYYEVEYFHNGAFVYKLVSF